jgi:hypothetical protein
MIITSVGALGSKPRAKPDRRVMLIVGSLGVAAAERCASHL